MTLGAALLRVFPIFKNTDGKHDSTYRLTHRGVGIWHMLYGEMVSCEYSGKNIYHEKRKLAINNINI